MQGEWSYAIFDPEMHKSAIIKWAFEEKLKLAIQKEEFMIFYQPIISLKNNKIEGFEALARWKHPSEGFISPAEFIPVAESNGLIIPLGKWIFNAICQQVQAWKKLSILPEDFTISINISSKQFSETLVQEINDALKKTGTDSKNIKIEITESLMLEKSEIIDSLFEELSNLNIQLSIDDFGTGYSSLSSLHKFPINTLKVDQSFVRDITSSKKHFEIVKTIISLAHNLATVVVAEGVETKEQLEILKAFSCDYVQGYYFYKPQDATQAEVLLKNLSIG